MAKILITGSTGMIGKGIALEAIEDSTVETVALINRSPLGVQHAKIKEFLLKDFKALDSLAKQLGHLDACFHCMGVSSVGMNEAQYSELTFDISKSLADLCFEINPLMTFNYVSGQGTDGSEKSRQMWARVKGKTENYILSKGFGKSYMFRPGIILPEKGIRSRTKLYDRIYMILRPLFPFLKKMDGVTTTTKIAQAMINSLCLPQAKDRYLDNKAINALAQA